MQEETRFAPFGPTWGRGAVDSSGDSALRPLSRMQGRPCLFFGGPDIYLTVVTNPVYLLDRSSVTPPASFFPPVRETLAVILLLRHRCRGEDRIRGRAKDEFETALGSPACTTYVS